ncbi:PAB-dependent poly(A)-specific ribonuclease subunit 2 [Babesia caballi]|uniref:PAB-dependent poly(A)-specific ribonuclease subunit 2 n=1 Tax=Babesia caballi TaxID=5871 RepID=A0AAV4LL84_BABCB|nr:PAB-dependent poly(A)-specific ribonuclease subunit 2 [Babesia caballi]
MRHGIVKYDRWENVIWLYNGIESQIRTPLTGAIVGINAEDNTIKYNHWGLKKQKAYDSAYEGAYNGFCGCFMCNVNAIQPYETGLIVANAKGVEILNRDGGRRMRLTSEKAESQMSNYGNNHIVCSLLNCAPNNATIWMAANCDNLYAVDSFVGQISGTIKLSNSHPMAGGIYDQITVLGDQNGNSSRSSCLISYYHQPVMVEEAPADSNAAETSLESTELADTTSLSLESIAMKYGDIDSIPEFVPLDLSNVQPTGTFIKQRMSQDKTAGAVSLGYAIAVQGYNETDSLQSRDTSCVGMLSGLLHIVDRRMQKIAHTIEAHNTAVGSIAAYGTYIVTTGCYLYGNVLMHEPLLEVHDIRMKRTTSLWLGAPIRSTAIVPGSNRVVAMQDNGWFFDCDLKTMVPVRHPNMASQGAWIYHDVEVGVLKESGVHNVYLADEAYTLNIAELQHRVELERSVDPCKLMPIFQKIRDGAYEYFNNTQFASMIGTFTGDVVHVFVQVFFFLEKLTSLRYHCCEVEHCITCELGFALHMLHVANENRKRGHVEEEHRFLPGRKPELQVPQLQELMPVDRSETNAASIQRLLLWVIEKMNSELDSYYSVGTGSGPMKDPQLIKNIFGFTKTVDATCQNGHATQKTLENEFCLDYSQLISGTAYEEKITAYCPDCSKHVVTQYHIDIGQPPNFMIVQCEQGDEESRVMGVDEHVRFNSENYTLATIMFSVPSEDSSYRLLAYVRVPSKMKSRQKWLLINDGYVCELTNEDIDHMLDFSPPWKELITLIYKKDDIGVFSEIVPMATGDNNVVNVNGRIVPLPVPHKREPIPASIFISESNIAHNPMAHGKHRSFVPLSVNELIALHQEEFIVALDVEGGQRREGHWGGRGDPFPGPLHPSEKASKGLSHSVGAEKGVSQGDRFSGIHQGDLDLKSSVHWLTTRKAIYLKIRYLVDAGCKILGHGLEQDFKMLNIVVPQHQVIDTVELYRLPGQRYISLQFLAAHILNRRIQRGEHDSVEDALAALDLYR